MNFFSLFKRNLIYKIRKKISIDSENFESRSLDFYFHKYGSDKANIFRQTQKSGHGFSIHYENKIEKFKDKKIKKVKIEDALVKILSSPDHSNKSWITNQYDQMVMCDTAQKSGSDAAIIRIHNKDKAIAVSVDSSANYCKSFPLTGVGDIFFLFVPL